MSKRLEFSKRTKLEAFERAGGKCEGENHFGPRLKLATGNIEYHHICESTMGGDNGLGNCQVLCRTCHRAITGIRAAVISKSSRQRARHLGIKRRSSRPLPGGKTDKLKKKISGEVVERKL